MLETTAFESVSELKKLVVCAWLLLVIKIFVCSGLKHAVHFDSWNYSIDRLYQCLYSNEL